MKIPGRLVKGFQQLEHGCLRLFLITLHFALFAGDYDGWNNSLIRNRDHTYVVIFWECPVVAKNTNTPLRCTSGRVIILKESPQPNKPEV